MKELKIYISAGIFIALTAIRLLSPQTADAISDAICNVLNMETEQTQTVIAIGSSLTSEDIFEAIKIFESSDSAPDAEKPLPTASPLPMPSPTPTPAPEPTIDPKVEKYLRSQEAFSEYSTPANVSIDLLVLPFEYTSPIEAVKSSGFGYRMHPIQNKVKFHYGTDLAANTGTAVQAFADGKIKAIGEDESFGNYMIIDHADGFESLYAHCSELLQSGGDVKKGDVIARVGQTGAATGPHLHFELTHDGVYLNPEFYI